MKKHLIATGLIASVALLGAAGPAMAAHVNVGINIGIPGLYAAPAPVYVEPQPVYVQPQPVYVQPQPVYVQQQPVYVEAPRPWYVETQGGWHRHYYRERGYWEHERHDRDDDRHHGHGDGDHDHRR